MCDPLDDDMADMVLRRGVCVPPALALNAAIVCDDGSGGSDGSGASGSSPTLESTGGGGCTCRLADRRHHSAWWLLLLAIGGIALRRVMRLHIG